MQANVVSGAVTVSLDEAKDILEVKKVWVAKLIAIKVLVPFVQGKSGRGNGSRISGQQLYGLATIVGLIEGGKKPPPAYMREVLAMYEAMSNDALIEFSGGKSAGGEVNDRTEEAITDYVSKLELTGMFRKDQPPMTATDVRCKKCMTRLMARVDDAIKIRRRQPLAERRPSVGGKTSSVHVPSNKSVGAILRGKVEL